MKSSRDLLADLRKTMAGFVGKEFTEEMRQIIRLDATEIMTEANAEGQAAFAPLVCSNKGTSFCPQTEDEKDVEEYETGVCRQCFLDGGFLL